MSRKIKVLSECRSLLRLMNLCHKPEIRICCVKVPHFVAFIVLSMPLCYSVAMHTWEAFEIGMDLKKVATILLTIAGTAQMQLIYFCLQFKNQNVIHAVDRIQEVVDRSKISLQLNFSSWKYSKLNQISFFGNFFFHDKKTWNYDAKSGWDAKSRMHFISKIHGNIRGNRTKEFDFSE